MLDNKFDLDYLIKKAGDSIIYNQHAAGILQNKKIINYGINKYVNSSCEYKRTIHAEISAFTNLSKKCLKGLNIIVIRIKNNRLKNSRPCNHCIDKLIKVGIYKVYYSNENGIIVSEIVEEMEKMHISSGTKYQLGLV